MIRLDNFIDIEYNKRLDCQPPCLEDELNEGSNNIVRNLVGIGSCGLEIWPHEYLISPTEIGVGLN